MDEVGPLQQSAKTKSEDTCAGKLGIKSVSVVKAIGHQKCLFQAIKVECKLSTPQLNAELIPLEAAESTPNKAVAILGCASTSLVFLHRLAVCGSFLFH